MKETIKFPEALVVSAFLKAEQKVNSLTRFQKWLCKIFKIEPACEYRQTFDLILSQPSLEYGIHVGDHVIFEDYAQFNDKEQWRVMDAYGGKRIRISNVMPLKEKRSERQLRTSKLVVLGRMLNEISPLS